MTQFRYSAHAFSEMVKRNINRSDVDDVLAEPMQKITEQNEIVCYQSKMHLSGKPYLLRIMVNEIKAPFLVVTVYKTSKIDKYWRQP
jgi:hypothetical protein